MGELIEHLKTSFPQVPGIQDPRDLPTLSVTNDDHMALEWRFGEKPKKALMVVALRSGEYLVLSSDSHEPISKLRPVGIETVVERIKRLVG